MAPDAVSTNLPPPSALARFAPGAEVIAAYRAASARAGVWRLRVPAGDVMLKLHRDPTAYATELFAYTQWTAGYAPCASALLDFDDACRGLLLTAIDGLPFRPAHLPPSQALTVYAQAGARARRVRDLGVGPYFGAPVTAGPRWTDPVAYMAAFFATQCAPALHGDLLHAAERELAAWAAAHFAVYAGEQPVPVNRDFTPKNWLVDVENRLVGMIDFEHMGWGIAAETFAPLWARHFPALPGSEAAFVAGYGAQPARACPAQVRHLLILTGLADIAWGARHGRADRVQCGHGLLARVGACQMTTPLPST